MSYDVEALKVEREGYVRRGLKDRVAQVDALLAAAGEKLEQAPVEQATAAPGEARQTRRRG